MCAVVAKRQKTDITPSEPCYFLDKIPKALCFEVLSYLNFAAENHKKWRNLFRVNKLFKEFVGEAYCNKTEFSDRDFALRIFQKQKKFPNAKFLQLNAINTKFYPKNITQLFPKLHYIELDLTDKITDDFLKALIRYAPRIHTLSARIFNTRIIP